MPRPKSRSSCHRVEFNTDSKNIRSQAALAALGAMKEGVLRSWSFTNRGDRRDNVIFSILREDWPESKRRLLHRLKGMRSTEAL